MIFQVIFYFGLVVKGIAVKWWLDHSAEAKRRRGAEAQEKKEQA